MNIKQNSISIINYKQTIWLIVLFFIFFLNNNVFSQNKAYKLNTVVIDAGHGGKDPGALGKTVKEKDIALKIALLVGSYIEKNIPDVKVVYTRKKDIFIPLDKRSEIANKVKADLFISIHANANRNYRIKGTETYTLGLHKTKENLELAMKENSVMLYEEDYSTKYQGFDPNAPASYIIFNLMQGVNVDKSILMAQLTENQFAKRVGRQSRGVRQAGFWVLKKVSMPSILVEVGFVSNPTEEKYLRSKKGQVYLASGIYRAFKEYKTSIEKSSLLLSKKTNNNTAQKTNNKTTKKKVAKTNNKNIYFYIQVASSIKPLNKNSRVYRKVKNVKQIKMGNRYKYFVGKIYSLKEAKEKQRKIKTVIPDCFILAYNNGKRISISQASKLIK
ncbi:MAG: N-acetylmuramoyl-L-alanine amidase [Marinifilaceae bacterium]|jgi:N-acetylmuramoyl-L-alanine amidase|nr:N-acetylmuramoyl-L-alanine amidase [Marinifilaceae bacterium]